MFHFFYSLSCKDNFQKVPKHTQQLMQHHYPNNIRPAAESSTVTNRRLESAECKGIVGEMTEMGYNGVFDNIRKSERLEDPTLRGLLASQVYSIQRVPGDGSCFFYTIAMILLGYIENYSRGEPNELVLCTMKCLRSITAYAIYEDPLLLQGKRLYDSKVGDMEFTNGKPDARDYFDYFLKGEYLPCADDPEVGVVQHLPMFANTLFVIYNSNGRRQIDFVCHMTIPNVVYDVVLIRRSGNNHYEPIVFNVGGRWQHRLSVDERFTPQFKNLFQALWDQCPPVRVKIPM
jgi:hypothetical protein